MKKSIRVYVFVTTLFSTMCLLGQDNFLDGYIINLKEDTIRGLIDFQDWDNNPSKIKFKINKNSNFEFYSPIDILEFCVGNNTYISGKVKIENSPYETDRLEENSELKIIEKKVFLQTLIKGEKSLYEYKDKDIKENFYIKTDSGLNLLLYKRYLKKDTFNTRSLRYFNCENNNYKGLLAWYLKDCSSTLSRLSLVSYTKKDLIDIFEKYYICINKPVYKKKIEDIKFKYGILAGISSTNLKFNSNSNQFKYLTNWEENTSFNLTGAVFGDLILPNNRKKWVIHNELMFSSYKITGLFNSKDLYSQNYEYNTTYELSYIKLNNMLRYNFIFGNTNLFLNGGFSNGLAIKNKSQQIVNIETTGNVISNTSSITEIRKYEQGLLIGAGINYKKILLEFRTEIGNGMSYIERLNSTSSRYFILLGFQIN